MKPPPCEIPSERAVSFTVEGVRAEMRQHVRTVADLAPEDSRKAALRFAANVLRLPFARVKAYFYDEVRNVPAHEADQIRAYVEAAEKLIEAKHQYEAIRREYLATAHPSLARFTPGELAGKTAATCEEASAVVKRAGRTAR